MAKQVVSFLLLLSVIALFPSGLLVQSDQTFDYFQLIEEWPLSICSADSRVMNPLPFNFTIHGLWPRNYFGAFLLYCKREPYRPIEWEELVDNLNRVWPSINHGVNQNTVLWSLQSDKHGTCSLMFYHQLMYFDLAVELHDSYNLLQALEDKEIVPTNLFMYSIQEIKDAVKAVTTKDPDFNCVRSRKGNLLISDIRLCFTPGGDITDCFRHRQAAGCTAPFAYLPETLM